MEIIHQLTGRVRIRIPGLESQDYCRQVREKLKNDVRINDFYLTLACNSLTLYYDAKRIKIKDVFKLLGEEEIKKPTAAEKKPPAAKKSAEEKGEEKLSKVVEKTKATDKLPESRVYFKPAVSVDVQEKIRQLIENEDPRKPYSDDSISRLLNEENIDLARRTVAKYREKMDIPPSSKRRK